MDMYYRFPWLPRDSFWMDGTVMKQDKIQRQSQQNNNSNNSYYYYYYYYYYYKRLSIKNSPQQCQRKKQR